MFDVGTHDLGRIGRGAALVLSPGIPPTAPVVRAAIDAGVPMLAEAQVGLDGLQGVPYFAVTGNQRQNQTTALIITDAGCRRRSVAAGNSHALSVVALDPVDPEWMAVELSSFQLHDMPGVNPTIGVLTNLAPDHLDRYSTLDEYFADKRRMFANAHAGSIWISNADDMESRQMVAGLPGMHRTFSTRSGVQADGQYDHASGQLFLSGKALIGRGELPLLGDHNVANALAAALAVSASGIPVDAIATGLRTFTALPHRMEPVREVGGVVWINDSKATNVASTLVAVEAMTRPFVLLLGGRHKGEPYTALADPLRRHAVAVVAYGEASQVIMADLRGVVPIVQGGSFDDVLARARALAPVGGAVLLSPACSSYDMFDNYEQRGARFRSIAEAW